MALMVALSVGLRFWQEVRADAAAARLKAMIHVTSTVMRDGKVIEIPLRDLVPARAQEYLFYGASVESGTATAVIVTTGIQIYLGSMAESITLERVPTSFDDDINRFTWLMIQLMAVMVPLVFLINGLTKHDRRGAFFFAMAVAVGLTPEMLPMVVSVCLSKGALAMSRRTVVVKRLNAIQNVGGMDVLCTEPLRVSEFSNRARFYVSLLLAVQF